MKKGLKGMVAAGLAVSFLGGGHFVEAANYPSEKRSDEPLPLTERQQLFHDALQRDETQAMFRAMTHPQRRASMRRSKGAEEITQQCRSYRRESDERGVYETREAGCHGYETFIHRDGSGKGRDTRAREDDVMYMCTPSSCSHECSTPEMGCMPKEKSTKQSMSPQSGQVAELEPDAAVERVRQEMVQKRRGM